jgi:cytochrome b6
MSQFQVLKVFGNWFPGKLGKVLGVVVFTGGLVLWFLIPLYDNTKEAGRRARHATWCGLLTLMALIVTTIWAYLAI